MDGLLAVKNQRDLEAAIYGELDTQAAKTQRDRDTRLLLRNTAKIAQITAKKPTLKTAAILDGLRREQEEIRARLSLLENDQSTPAALRDELIKTGKITPFDKHWEDAYQSSSTATSPSSHQQINDEPQEDKTDDESSDQEIHSDDDRLDSAPKTYLDDGDEIAYQNRLRNIRPSTSIHPDTVLSGGLKIPSHIHAQLFAYQKTCLKWLWELHQQQCGGILGDEMGLGKTIQIISFLASLDNSSLLNNKPILIVCPATILQHWVKEFHKWWPSFRVAILHSSGNAWNSNNNKRKYSSDEEEYDEEEFEYEDRRGDSRMKNDAKRQTKKLLNVVNVNQSILDLIDRIVKNGNVLVTTYSSIRTYKKYLIPVKWAYVILDEGHHIRNPDAAITLAVKQLRTCHRIILSGTPIQNNLIELWSLYDFVFPGRLGTLPVFQSEFAIPINLGGYANANNFQVQTAYKCACILKDLISPYLLRRLKQHVEINLPDKVEQVLFCRMTDYQIDEYKKFLAGDEVSSILAGKRHALYGIDILRKICNHPDLVMKESNKSDYGMFEKSGKMKVVSSLFKMWKTQNHRCLLFCQTRQMLDIIEKLVVDQGYRYLRMDGNTSIKTRQNLVEEFNTNEDIFVFLLTTKVGGIGVNLTGANRLILFDPDWNPASDLQARERSWRIGQEKQVTIYRLMTSGTIEEKIYHRQIFKTFLTNKILKDPKQQRFFKSNDMHELFTLNINADEEHTTETADLFSGMGVEIKRKQRKKRRDGEKEELLTIEDINKVDQFKDTTGEEEKKKVVKNQDQEILDTLFKNSGVHSALHHDKIFNSSRSEHVIVEKEATLISNRAITALKASRKQVREQQTKGRFTPTWTGKSGRMGAPELPSSSSHNPPPASSSILSNLRQMQNMSQSTPISENLEESTSLLLAKDSKDSFAIKIRDFLVSNGQKATSSEIVSNFQLAIKDDDVLVFKKMLRGIANFIKVPGGGKGYWELKKDFE